MVTTIMDKVYIVAQLTLRMCYKKEGKYTKKEQRSDVGAGRSNFNLIIKLL